MRLELADAVSTLDGAGPRPGPTRGRGGVGLRLEGDAVSEAASTSNGYRWYYWVEALPDVVGLKASDLKVALFLACWAENRTGLVKVGGLPSRAELADRAGMTADNVTRCLGRLERAGVIRRVQHEHRPTANLAGLPPMFALVDDWRGDHAGRRPARRLGTLTDVEPTEPAELAAVMELADLYRKFDELTAGRQNHVRRRTVERFLSRLYTAHELEVHLPAVFASEVDQALARQRPRPVAPVQPGLFDVADPGPARPKPRPDREVRRLTDEAREHEAAAVSYARIREGLPDGDTRENAAAMAKHEARAQRARDELRRLGAEDADR